MMLGVAPGAAQKQNDKEHQLHLHRSSPNPFARASGLVISGRLSNYLAAVNNETTRATSLMDVPCPAQITSPRLTASHDVIHMMEVVRA
ncbi:hypothetical protein Aduo_005685 [Ancylostoma duodenale]